MAYAIDNDSTTTQSIIDGIRSVSGNIDPTVIRESLDNWKNVPVHFGVVGETNSGKSSFINAIRGVKDDDKEAAKVDVMECTVFPHKYQLPENKNIIFWDLPGFGTPSHPKEKYLETIKVNNFDILLIISCVNFTANDFWLANELKKRNKKFYFIRSKIDIAVSESHQHDPVEITSAIKNDALKSLADIDITCPVFLVSNHDREKYDLQEILPQFCKDCKEFKTDAIALSFKNVYSTQVLNDKKKALQKRIPKVAFLSAVATALPLPGTGIFADIAIITEEILHYRSVLGLNEERIKKAAETSGTSEENIIKLFSAASFGVVSARVIAMTSSIVATATFQATLKSVFPFIAGVIIAPFAYVAMSLVLSKTLDAIYEDAVKLHQLVSCRPVKAREIKEIKFKKEVKVAIIGKARNGKSSFINAFRDIKSSHIKAAKVGLVETTTELVEYKVDDYEWVTLVDTPGIGTKDVSINTFLRLVKLKKYAIVIVCVQAEIHDDDMRLLRTATKHKKPVVLVRTKVSLDIENHNKMRKTESPPEKIVKEIKKKLETKLIELNLNEVKVFLIDNKEAKKYEFEDLKNYILEICFNAE